ncbi:unnamed protein product [Rotaria magnacalcarata]|uniref:Lysozyme n=3 Tax=Rotaria magnacalcarata TaxID=392030 RepID=A0A816FF32_9BILA|nr:unnamed protein product [Rotaria magnacalcarata]CAF1660728.1 unnamed protein product [Rotaria magnacalcarata]CAF3855399.1 unnamed protein product [Rotaria magnacalcarata]CAF3894839.1 unnamed protein product [Rotaria magnacalcarata]CAF3906142.1 unnamed protein product [Rotaria magnacalcarata]
MMMMHSLYFLVFLVVSIASECSLRQTKLNEGTRLCCYYDTKRIPTIGVGFNLQRKDAEQVLRSYGVKKENVLNDCMSSTRKSCITDYQATDIFKNYAYPEASACAASYAPGMPTSVHAALTDVAFAGCGTLKGFVKMRAALYKNDWKSASNELKNSVWCKDVKSNRCNLNMACIASGN